MLKFTYLAQLGLAGTVLVPAVVLEQDPAGGLTDALANTRASIESLERLHTSLTNGDYAHVATTLDATQSPTGDARESDERLVFLREEVSRLQMRWDALENALSSKVSRPAPVTTPANAPVVIEPKTAPSTTGTAPVTTGMNESARSALAQRLVTQETAAVTSVPQEKTSYEPTGFTAHAVRHGRAYYKAGRYEGALALLSRSTEQAGARFWIACTLEKLGRIDEAIEAYEVVVQSPLDAKYAQHAQRNREFLLWKRDFESRIASTTTIAVIGETK